MGLHSMSPEAQVLEDSLRELWQREKDYESACLAAADSEHAFKIKQAKEFKSAEGSVEARKADALIACDNEYKNYLTADAVKDFTKVKMIDIQQATNARQSLLSAAAKSDFNHANSRGTT